MQSMLGIQHLEAALPVEPDEDRVRQACQLVQEAVVSDGPKEDRQVQETQPASRQRHPASPQLP